jgi:hypothetical protein
MFCAPKKPVKARGGQAKKMPLKSHFAASEGILISSDFDYFKKISFLNGYLSGIARDSGKVHLLGFPGKHHANLRSWHRY